MYTFPRIYQRNIALQKLTFLVYRIHQSNLHYFANPSQNT